MITYNELKEKCTCWTGYKRKPGTKPCESGSCVKEGTDDVSKENHHVMAFGRMNPITSGHEAVVNKLHSVAKEHGATHNLVVSHSQDAKKNPLTAEQKVKHAKNAFPKTNVTPASKEAPTILHHAAAAHKAGATHLHVVAGSDRHEEMHNLLHKYNGKDSAHGHYNFKKITVHSSGERDPDSEGTTGISASKMREHASSGNKAEFHKGAPSKMKPEHKDAMYNDVRKGMSIKEETTPYWKKPSFNKRMSQMAKQERLERERKEAEKKPVKEETLDQQDDRKNQLKRFSDQLASMSKPNGPSKETEKELDDIEKDIMTGSKPRSVSADVDPIQNRKTKKIDPELIPEEDSYLKQLIGRMRKGEKLDALQSQLVRGHISRSKKYTKHKNEINVDEETIYEGHYEDAESHLAKASKALETSDMMAHHGHMADHHDSLSQWHDSKGRGSAAQKHADKSEEHADKYTALAQKASGSKKVSEGVIQTNGTDKLETATSAPTNSTVKDTTMGKKAKGFKFFHGEGERIAEAAQKGVNVDKVNTAGQKPHEEKFETVKKKMVKEEELSEVLSNKAPAAEWIKDFISSDNPKFAGKSKDKRKQMALAAYYAKQRNEEFEIGEELKGGQKKLDKNKNGKLDKQDFKLLRKEEVENLDEKSIQARRNKTYKNLMAASKGARVNKDLGMTPADTGHKNNQQMNKAIGRAVTRGEVHEAVTGNPGRGYHGEHPSADDRYKETHAHVKNLTDGDDKIVKHYMDSTHGRHLAGREQDHEYIKKDFKKFKKYYNPEMHESATTTEGNMKSYKEFLQSLDEVKMADLPSRKIQGTSYGANYEDPEGADETKADMKKPAKAAGRKSGQSVGSYKPRKTLSKLRQA